MNDILLLGIITGLIFTELTDLSPGGIIVPAYFAMYAYDWQRMLGTILLSFLCVFAVRFFSTYMILYGRRRYSVYLLTGILLKYLVSCLGAGTAFSIGSLIPGILGREIERQKPLPTLLSLGIVTLIIRFLFLLTH